MSEWTIAGINFIELHIEGNNKRVAIAVNSIDAFGELNDKPGAWLQVNGDDFSVKQSYDEIKKALGVEK